VRSISRDVASAAEQPRKTKGIKATARRNSLPYAGYRISRVEENYYLRASRWPRTYLPSPVLIGYPEAAPTRFSRRVNSYLLVDTFYSILKVVGSPDISECQELRRVRYVRGIPYPHSAYASAEIPAKRYLHLQKFSGGRHRRRQCSSSLVANLLALMTDPPSAIPTSASAVSRLPPPFPRWRLP